MASGTVEQLRELDEAPALPEAWRIDFPGPIPATQWPDTYKRWFAPIREIGRTYYDEYIEGTRRGCRLNRLTDSSGDRITDNQAIEEKEKQVRNLNRLARKCRRERRNEAGWRSGVETTVFGRFDAEVVW